MKTGYGISLNRCFRRPALMRTLEEIRSEIVAVEQNTEGLPTDTLGEK